MHFAIATLQRVFRNVCVNLQRCAQFSFVLKTTVDCAPCQRTSFVYFLRLCRFLGRCVARYHEQQQHKTTATTKTNNNTIQQQQPGQVFDTVNTFLREDPAARKRRLKVFTYTIVPLSPDSGVLEWVEDTMPFGSFLTDRGAGRAGAHRRYFPKDW